MPLPRPPSADPRKLYQWATQLVQQLESGKGISQDVEHYVGDTATGLGTTFQNSWVNFDTFPSRAARFWKDASGVVHLAGVIKSGTINTTAFTLPPGYRPQYSNSVHAVDSQAAFGELIINFSGTVVPSVGSNVFVFLDGVTFKGWQ